MVKVCSVVRSVVVAVLVLGVGGAFAEGSVLGGRTEVPVPVPVQTPLLEAGKGGEPSAIGVGTGVGEGAVERGAIRDSVRGVRELLRVSGGAGGMVALTMLGEDMGRLGAVEWVEEGRRECAQRSGVEGQMESEKEPRWERLCRVLEVVNRMMEKAGEGSLLAVKGEAKGGGERLMLKMVVDDTAGGWPSDFGSVVSTMRGELDKADKGVGAGKGKDKGKGRGREVACDVERAGLDAEWVKWEGKSYAWRLDSRLHAIQEGAWMLGARQVQEEVLAGSLDVKTEAGRNRVEAQLKGGLAKVQAVEKELDVRKKALVVELLGMGKRAAQWESRCEVACEGVDVDKVVDVMRGSTIGYKEARMLQCYMGS